MKTNMATLGKNIVAGFKISRILADSYVILPTARYRNVDRYTSSSTSSRFTTDIPEVADFPGVHSHTDLYDFSLREPDKFWSVFARSRLRWYKDFDIVSQCDMTHGDFAWFLNGKLNVSVNCVDRHAERNPSKVALIWEKDEPGHNQTITYRKLKELVCRFGNVLRAHGVQQGDRVVIYMPVSPLAVAAMLACARIAQAHTVITTDQGVRGGKLIELKRTVDDAVRQCPHVRRVFVGQRTGAAVPMGPLDIPLEQELAGQPAECEPAVLDSEDLLFILYTSGSTGQPKGMAHTQAGYLLYAMLTHKFVFDYQEGDVYCCVADVGWITGHSYVVYGPLSNGATTVLFESVPTYPDPGRYWEMVERLKINQFYGAPTALRLLLRFPDSFVTKYDRSSLRTLGCETGGITITPRPSEPDAPINPGEPMRPFYGIQPAILDRQKQEVTAAGEQGALCIRRPWPGIARAVYGARERYLDTYFSPYPGVYAYITLKEDVTETEEEIMSELKQLVRKEIAAFAVPEMMQVTAGLPKTRSGKIMRRVLRKVAENKPDELGDISTLADSSVVEGIVTNHARLLERMRKTT